MLIPMNTGLVRRGGFIGSGASITSTFFQKGERNNASPTSYETTLDITTNSSCVFVVSRMREDGSAAADSLTVGGVAATLIDSYTRDNGDILDHSILVYYAESVPTGFRTTTITGDGCRSTAIAAFMLDGTTTPVVTLVPTSVSDGGTTGLKDIATVPTVAGEFVYFLQPTTNYSDAASSEVSPAEGFAPIDQADCGVISLNMMHLCSDLSTAPRDVTGKIFVNNTSFGTQNFGRYIKIGI